MDFCNFGVSRLFFLSRRREISLTALKSLQVEDTPPASCCCRDHFRAARHPSKLGTVFFLITSRTTKFYLFFQGFLFPLWFSPGFFFVYLPSLTFTLEVIDSSCCLRVVRAELGFVPLWELCSLYPPTKKESRKFFSNLLLYIFTYLSILI